MTPIEKVLMVLRGIATLLVNPALGGGGVGALRAKELLEMLATLVQGGERTWNDLEAFADEIALLVAQNGSPTRGQWEAMQARDAAVRATLAARAAELEAKLKPPASEEPPAPPSDPVS